MLGYAAPRLTNDANAASASHREGLPFHGAIRFSLDPRLSSSRAMFQHTALPGAAVLNDPHGTWQHHRGTWLVLRGISFFRCSVQILPG